MSRTARVFVSYRRQDTRHVAGRLADRLVEHFDVFMDMDTIEPGTDFTDVIRQAVESCDIFLSVIGASWTTVTGEQGQRRLDDSADWVVTETAIALQRGVPVIPVLVDGATMPARAELPPDLAPLASRQAVTIRHESFTSDVNHLIGAIERRLERTPAAAAPAPAPAEDRRTAQLAAWSSQADRAAAEGRWADAVILLENIRSLDPSYPDLGRRLQVATARRQDQSGTAEARRRHLSDLYVRAGQAEAAGRFDEAVAALAEVVQLDPANTDAARRLAALRQRGGPGFAAPAPLAHQPPAFSQPTPYPQPTPFPQPTPYGQPTPPPRPPDGPVGAPAYFAPPPERKRNRTWIIVAVAAVVVALVVVGVLVLPGRTGAVIGPPTTTPSAPTDPPSSVVPTPTPTPSPTSSLSTSELRTHIPRNIRSACDDYTPPTGDPLEANLVGALRCELTTDGAPAKV